MIQTLLDNPSTKGAELVMKLNSVFPSEIKKHLRFMNEMEILLNFDEFELAAEFQKLTEEEKTAFINNLNDQFAFMQERVESFKNKIQE